MAWRASGQYPYSVLRVGREHTHSADDCGLRGQRRSLFPWLLSKQILLKCSRSGRNGHLFDVFELVQERGGKGIQASYLKSAAFFSLFAVHCLSCCILDEK